MINYAHRGASEYAPENTLSSFYLGLLQGANGIETDVRRTLDGHLVLFHDKKLERVTDGSGILAEHTLAELKELRVFGNSTNSFYDRIPTYREFLEHFARYDIRFAIELKAEGIEEDVLCLSKEFGLMEKTTFTSNNLEYLKNLKELEPTARIGWLLGWKAENISDEEVEMLLSIGGEEICPIENLTTEESVAAWRARGLGVRAWGVKDVATMKRLCALGVDGMTVNFPDRLYNYLTAHKS